MKKIGEASSPLKLWGSIIGLSLLITGSIFLITSFMREGVEIIRNCDDGIDNDGDSWTDLEDPDCLSGTQELWFALSDCSDGFDNDKDGLIDKQDGDCENALDVSEVNHPSNPACSDGIDNDEDSLFDFPIDPGCSSIDDNSEDSEGRGSNLHNFEFYFAADTQLIELNWTNSSGQNRRIVWDELTRHGPPSYVPSYFHSIIESRSIQIPSSWNMTYKSGDSYKAWHANLTYSFLNRDDDLVTIQAESERIKVIDEIRFYEDIVFVTVTITNKLSEEIFLELPVNLGSLMLGNFDENLKINRTITGLSRLLPNKGGFIQTLDNQGLPHTIYPKTAVQYAPVTAMWDDKLTIGGQFLTKLDLPTFGGFREHPFYAHTPAILTKINTGLKANQEKSFVLSFKIAEGNNWQETLTPYKEWFDFSYGQSPSYCPTAPFMFMVGWNANQFNHPTACTRSSWCNESHPDWRYYSTTLEDIFMTESSRDVMQSFGIKHFGLWTTTLHSTYLTETSEWLEFNPTIDLLDPNIDAGPNPERIQEFTDSYRESDIGIFWFSRPCAQIYGADIKYNQDGTYKIIKGEPSGFNDVDLRNVNNRDKAIEQMDHFVKRGVEGFYLDAMACPGDFAFIKYAKKTFRERYGVDLFVVKEGAVDRDSLNWPQIPNIKLPQYSYNLSSVLIDYLVPEGTYYGGRINTILTDPEFDDVLSRGYIAVLANSPPIIERPDLWKEDWCKQIDKSYENRYDRWLSYGNSIGCAAIEQNPPSCPVTV